MGKRVVPEGHVKVISNSIRGRVATVGGINIMFDEKGVGFVAPHEVEAVEREMAFRPNRFRIERTVSSVSPVNLTVQEVSVVATPAPKVEEKVETEEVSVSPTVQVVERQAELPVVVSADSLSKVRKYSKKDYKDKEED